MATGVMAQQGHSTVRSLNTYEMRIESGAGGEALPATTRWGNERIWATTEPDGTDG